MLCLTALFKFREGFIELELAVLYINAVGVGRWRIVDANYFVFVNKSEKTKIWPSVLSAHMWWSVLWFAAITAI